MALEIKAFREERSAPGPKWEEVNNFLKEKGLTREAIIAVSAYPSGNHHNLVLIYDAPEE